MPITNPNYAPGFPRAGFSPALDALQQLGSASPGSGMVANPHRLTEAPGDMGPAFNPTVDPFPSGAGKALEDYQPWTTSTTPAIPGTPQMTPPPATPPAEVSGPDQILASLRMAYPGNRQHIIQGMAPERREKPSTPAIEG